MKRNSHDAQNGADEEPAQSQPVKKPKIDPAAIRAKLAQGKAKLAALKEKQAAAQATAQTSQRQDAPAAAAALPAAVAAAAPAQAISNAAAPVEDDVTLFDPSLQTKKRRPGLNLFQMGAVPQEHQDALHNSSNFTSADAAPNGPGEATLPPEPTARRIREPVPAMEWWDAAVFDQPTYEPGPDGTVKLKEAKISNLVEHPVPLEPPVEKPPPAPQALKLTKKEMKKIRKQRREEREKERQINIQTGLMEPPKDKVRLTNMPRVYGADGVVDATAIEMKVREAQREREAAHADRNLARKLTTAERKEKKLRKMFDDSAADTHVQVYRINDLQDGRHVYKIDINAVENRLTGVCATTKTGINVVVVEGDGKGMRRFQRLMMHRIDWNPMVNVDTADDAMFEEPNKCYIVWTGTVAKAAFADFKVHKCSTDQEARNFMAERGVAQYWDAAQHFVPTHEAVAT